MTAEAGIGKSRFAAEVKRFAAGYDVGTGGSPRTPVPGCCGAVPRVRRTPPVRPLADLVRKSRRPARRTSTATVTRPVVEERLRKLATRLGPRRRDRRVDIDRLLALLGYGEAPADPVGPAAGADWQPSGRRLDAEAIPVAVADLLTALARKRRWWSSWTTCTTRPPSTIDALGARCPARRSGGGAAAGPARAGAHRRRADPAGRRRGAHAAAAARRRRVPAAHLVPQRRQAAAAPTRTGCSPPRRATRSTWPSWSRC